MPELGRAFAVRGPRYKLVQSAGVPVGKFKPKYELFDMSIDEFEMKDLAADCAADKVYEFMFVAPAIPITGAVGSPTNPLAIK